jgi:hypothetical protein
MALRTSTYVTFDYVTTFIAIVSHSNRPLFARAPLTRLIHRILLVNYSSRSDTMP